MVHLSGAVLLAFVTLFCICSAQQPKVDVQAPGTAVKVTGANVDVKAPAGVKVDVKPGQKTVGVVAPLTNVTVNGTNVTVAVNTTGANTTAPSKPVPKNDVKVAAPGTKVDVKPNGKNTTVAVKAPGTTVAVTGNGAVGVKAPFTTVAVQPNGATTVTAPVVGQIRVAGAQTSGKRKLFQGAIVNTPWANVVGGQTTGYVSTPWYSTVWGGGRKLFQTVVRAPNTYVSAGPTGGVVTPGSA